MSQHRGNDLVSNNLDGTTGPSNPPEAPLTVQDILATYSEPDTHPDVQQAYQTAIDHLYQAMQEVIGKVEPVRYGKIQHDWMIEAQNELRAEQRTRLNKLFGREKDNE